MDVHALGLLDGRVQRHERIPVFRHTERLVRKKDRRIEDAGFAQHHFTSDIVEATHQPRRSPQRSPAAVVWIDGDQTDEE